MGGVSDKIIVTRMRHDNLNQRAVDTDAIKLLQHRHVHLGFATNVLKHVRHHDFAHAVIRQSPW